MAEYGYARRGYVPEGKSGLATRTPAWKSTYDSNGWAKTGEEYEDQVCTATIDAEGRKIISCTPNRNTENFATKTETIIEHIYEPVGVQYHADRAPKVDWRQKPNLNTHGGYTGYGGHYDADTNGWNRPSGNMIREPRFDVPLSKPTNDIETAVDYLMEPTKAPFATTTGTRPRWAGPPAVVPKVYGQPPTVDRTEGVRRYGDYTPTIDSVEAARRYGGVIM